MIPIDDDIRSVLAKHAKVTSCSYTMIELMSWAIYRTFERYDGNPPYPMAIENVLETIRLYGILKP